MQALLEGQKNARKLKDELAKGGAGPKTIAERVAHQHRLQFDEGAEIFAVQYTSIHKCADSDNIAGLKSFVLDSAADPNKKDRWGNAPIHLVAQRGHTNAVNLLLEFDADPNAQNNKGWSPVHEAVVGGHVEVLEILYERGADMVIRDATGATPAHLAAQADSVPVLAALHSFQDFPLRPDVMEIRQVNGCTPAHQAALYDSPAAIRFLWSIGADIDARDKMSETPAHKAARAQRMRALTALRECGVDTSKRNNEDDAVDDFAVDECRCWHTEL